MLDTPLAQHDGLSAVADDYDAFILDLWGVLHDGVAAYPGALDTLKALRAEKKRVLLLSNAPRPAGDVAARMAEMGIVPELYDDLMSSGEDAWRHLKNRPDDWYAKLGSRMLHIGPERDRVMFDGLDVEIVEDPEAADFVLATGLSVDGMSLDPVEGQIQAALARDLPMVCANPDLKVMRGPAWELCAGSMAKRYEELGGQVRYHGKPYRMIYDTCFALLDGVERGRLLAVGDTLHTDIAGARNAGIDSALVTGGIHREELSVEPGQRAEAGALERLFAKHGERPDLVLPGFYW